MTSQSILEFDEAQRRLRQLEQDHTEILELVGRLRQVRRSLEARAEMLEELGAATQSQLARGRAAVAQIERAVAGLKAEGLAVVGQLDSARQRLVEAMDERHATLESRCSRRSDEQQQALQSLVAQHASDMAALESRLRAQGEEAQRESIRRLSATQQELRSLVGRRSLVGGAAIGVAMLLAGYVLIGRISESPADADRASPPREPSQPATADGAPSGLGEAVASEKIAPHAAGALSLSDASGQQPRVWTDYRGRKARAVFQGFQNGTVYLRRPDNGRVCPVPLEGLSPDDQAYVQRIAQWRR